MGAAGSAMTTSDDIYESQRINAFCDEKLASIRYIPRKEDCIDATFPGPEGDGQIVPQKYFWLQGVCAAFVMFTDMGGKTLPELWDSYAGCGFTDYTHEEMICQAKHVMVKTLAPEMRTLITEGITEDDNQNAWTIAIGKIENRNLCAAHKPGEDIIYALTGEPDEEFFVPPSQWRDYVFKTDLFTSSGKLNGTAYRKDQLQKILNRPVVDSEIEEND